MADMFSKKERSRIMARIRSKDTSAEKLVFTYLNKQKIYYKKHYSRVLGKPDIALPRKKRAVFIDGDFWHGRHYTRILRSRPANDYWPTKIANNVKRDKVQRAELLANGWLILTIWESDIKRKSTCDKELTRIRDFLIN